MGSEALLPAAWQSKLPSRLGPNEPQPDPVSASSSVGGQQQ